MNPESQNWPSRFALRGRLIQQVDIWRKDQWSTCKSFVFNIFGSRDLLAPYLFLFLGRCRLIRSLHSVDTCTPAMLLVATALASGTQSSGNSWSYFVLWRFVHVQGQNIWNGHFGIVLLSRVFPLCKSSTARCADLTFLAAVCIASLPVGIPTRRFPL